jgi:hypothetical protein
LPSRCTHCRAQRRRQQYGGGAALDAGETLTRECVVCGAAFTWPRDDYEREFFRTRAWQAPRRCPNCRGRNNPQNL